MRNRALAAVGLLTVLVTACGSSQQSEVVEQIVIREPGDAEPDQSGPAVGDAGELDLVVLGAETFQMCTGCHVNDADARSGAGPNLFGVVGRIAGSREDYLYSDALANSEITWDQASLDAYLANPSEFVPGTDMLAGSVRDEELRAAIIAYLASTNEQP